MDTVRMHCVYPGPTMEKELGEALRMPLPLQKIKTRLPRIRSQRQAKDGAFFNVSSDRLKHRSLTCVRDDVY